MATNSVAIRLGIEGAAEVKRGVDDLGTSGEAAFDRIGKAADRAGTAADRTLERWKRMAQAAREAQSAERAQDSFNRQLGVAEAPSSSASRERMRDLEAAFATMPAKAQAVVVANDNITRSVGLQRYEWINLGRQIQDVGTMAAMGASGFQILASQGAQVYDVLSSSRGGVSGALKDVGSTLVGMVTPARVGLGAIVLSAGAAFVALNKVSNEANEANRALRTGAGLRSGLAASEVGSIAGNVPGMSTGTARSALLGYASTGANRENSVAALGMTRLLAEVSYEGDVGKAREGLTDAMRGGTASLMRYVETVRPLGAATTEWIEDIRSSRGEQAANRELLRLLNDGLAGAGIEIPLWRQALTKLGNAAGDLADAFLKEAARRANAEIDEVRRIGASVSRGLSTSSADARSGRPQAVIGGDRGPMLQRNGSISVELPPDGLDAVAGSIAELAAGAARGAAGSNDVRALTARYDAEGAALRKLKEDLAAYDRLLGDSNVTGQMTATQLAAARKAREDLSGAITSNISAEEKRRQTDELAIRSINARTDAERASIAAKQKELELVNQLIDPSERLRQIEAARTQELARSTRAAEDRLRASNDNLGLAGLLPYQRSQQEIEQRFRRQNEESAGNPDALRRNAQIRANELRQLDIEQIQGPLRSTTLSINEQVSALKVQRDSLFASDEAAAAMAARQDLVNAAIRSGIDPAKAYGGELEALAKRMGEMKAANDDFQRTKSNIVGGLDEARSAFSGTISGVISDLRSKRDPMQGIVNSLTRWGDQFVERTLLKPLTEGIFGRFGTTGGDSFLGGLLGKSFGSLSGTLPQTITTPIATINAATVNFGGMGSLGLGAAPGTGSPLTGAGSGITGFGLGGAQSAGTQAVGSGLGTFGFGTLGQKVAGTGNLAGVDLTGITKLNTDAQKEVAAYIATQASARGIDANTALRVFQQESSFNRFATNLTSREQSYGVTQLNTMGGLGAVAQRQGIDVTNPATWKQQVDFSLDTVAKDGWRQWYGARDVGISRWQGIGGRRADVGGEAEAASQRLANSTDQATDSMSSLSDAASSIPAGTDAATSSLSGLANSLLNFKPGEGGGINVAGLFGGGSSSGMSMTDVATWSANGNIMTSRGPVRLNMYERGGIATSPQVSVFGEGRLPEAYVPLPDGRSIPVTMKDAKPQTSPRAANSNGLITIAPTYNIPPLAAGVTPQDVVQAIEEYDRRLDRRLPARADASSRRFG